MKLKPKNNRFVWLIGAISEEYPDLKDVKYWPDTVLYDRQEKKPVMILNHEYANAFCLEHLKHGTPFTDAEAWLNSLDARSLKSEGITATHRRYRIK